MNMKQRAAEQAVEQIRSGMKLGLGSGSTVQYVFEALSQRLQAGVLHNIVGVPTSEATARQAHQLGIPLTTLADHPRLDLTIDGADEVDPSFALIKGLGGALFREKLVALASAHVLIVVDESKQVAHLGSKAPLPVEVLPFGWTIHLPLFERLGATPRRRTTADGQPYVTDNGNYIVDCSFSNGIEDPYELAQALDLQTGIVEHGLFLGLATAVCIGTAAGTEMLQRRTEQAI